MQSGTKSWYLQFRIATHKVPRTAGPVQNSDSSYTSGELGLRKYLDGLGHTFVVTSDKEGPNSEFERQLLDAEIVISQPFYPAYLTAERLAKAKKLNLAITAGIGSDHVDLKAAAKHGFPNKISFLLTAL